MKIALVLALVALVLWLLSLAPAWVFALMAAWVLIQVIVGIVSGSGGKAPPPANGL